MRPAHPGADDVAVANLDDGERAAIALALAVTAELVLMDDREGVGIALPAMVLATQLPYSHYKLMASSASEPARKSEWKWRCLISTR